MRDYFITTDSNSDLPQEYMERMKKGELPQSQANNPAGIVHSNCLEDALALADKVKTENGFKTVIINDISPSIGTHTGPGALGLLYCGAKCEGVAC